jgi:hypothetical protein
VNIETIEWCIDGWDEQESGDGRAAKAREQLAALVEAAGRATALVAALAAWQAWEAYLQTEPWDKSEMIEGGTLHQRARRLTRAALADAEPSGPGAAGARDETRRWEDGYAEGHAEGWRCGLKASEAASKAARALLTWHQTPAGRPGVYEPDDGEGLCAELAGELAALDALRAGGAGER